MKKKGSVPRPAPQVVLGPEAYRFGLQPSMSRSDILIECSFAFGKEAFEEAGEPARYGSAFHDLQADMLMNALRGTNRRVLPSLVVKRWGFEPEVIDEISPHVKAAYAELMGWLTGKNPYKLVFSPDAYDFLIEEALALKPLFSARRIECHDEDHRYHGLEQGEQPGTLDVGGIPKKRKLPVLVVDHKTGEEDFSRPETKPQLLSLAAAMMLSTGNNEAIVAVMHARRRGMPKIYSEKVTLDEVHSYEARLARGLDRIGDGSMRPGPWCKWCPAQEICPARDAQLLKTANDMLTSLTAAGGALSKDGLTANDVASAKVSPASLSKEKRLGHLYAVVKKAEVLAKRARDEIKQEILNDPRLLPVTPDNEYLVIRSFEKESISKQSIMDAYGKRLGLAMLEKLRKAGAITKATQTQMWPERERGR